MSALDRIIPAPRLVETDEIDLAVLPAQAWDVIRHGDLGSSPLVRALFTIRTLPERFSGKNGAPPVLRIDDLVSTEQHPGFQVLADDGGHALVVGAIGKVWHLTIPFVHVADGDAFAAFAEPGYVKVAWALEVAPLGETDTRLSFELRVDATDAASWARFQRYFALIGPGSRFIRRTLLASLLRRFGSPTSKEDDRPMPGDDLIEDAGGHITHGVTIAARPRDIWPWLVQMGGDRAGFYSIDALDNDGVRSAREIHPELQRLRVGDIIPAGPAADDGFEVLAIEPERALVLGGLYDVEARRQLPFDAARPERYWQTTWTFLLEPLDDKTTRLHVRARAAFPPSGLLHVTWIRPVHHLMEQAQLKRLAARIEGRLPRDDWRDVAEGARGVGVMIAAFLTPFLRNARSHWGLDEATANRTYAGDDLVPDPRWSWTHGIEIEADAESVWPWVAQLGADRGGFYSYQWLENVAGCELHNAEAVHPELALREGDDLRLHPEFPPFRVVSLEPGRHIVAHSPPPERDGPWIDASWAFFVEPLGETRCRVISRYRCKTSDDLASRIQFGSTLVEPVGFAMDRRMLMGIKERAEGALSRPHLRSFARRRSGERGPSIAERPRR